MGRLGNCRGCQAALGAVTALLVLTVLGVTNIWNPLPQLKTWWDHFIALSSPAPPWTVALGTQPEIAAVTSSGEVVLGANGLVEGYNPVSGKKDWGMSSTWALTADDVAVVRWQGNNPDFTGTDNTGYTVLDASNGQALWGQRDAQAVWAFSDSIMDLACRDSDHCELRVYGHDSGTPLWTLPLPGWAHALHGPDPKLLGMRDPAGWFAKAASGTPPPLPVIFGLTIDGQLKVVDTQLHKAYDIPPQDLRTQVTIAGQRIIFVRAEPDGDSCRFSVTAYDPHDLSPAWPPTERNWDVGTANGAGCAQHEEPVGAGGYFVAVNQQSQPMLVYGADGTPAWIGVPSEKVLATDGRLAAILTADRHTVKVIDLLAPAAPAIWSHKFGLDPQAAITDTQVIIRDGDNLRLYVYPRGLTLAPTELKTQSVVIGYGHSAIIIASARRFGIITVQA